MPLTNFTTNTNVVGTAGTKDIAVVASGTWDSATLTLAMYDRSSTTYVDVEAWTTDVAKAVSLGSGTQYKLTTTGGGGSLDIDVIHQDLSGT